MSCANDNIACSGRPSLGGSGYIADEVNNRMARGWIHFKLHGQMNKAKNGQHFQE